MLFEHLRVVAIFLTRYDDLMAYTPATHEQRTAVRLADQLCDSAVQVQLFGEPWSLGGIAKVIDLASPETRAWLAWMLAGNTATPVYSDRVWQLVISTLKARAPRPAVDTHRKIRVRSHAS